ncbi:HNH endonuclease [Deinococcus psychrotolerans]|uniref:HNH endonuclease n=1 Tax=Deinococcus psychrotolerans TaxID=2489213 RepID=A0A3G8YJN3_9DEIO|nr:HNH endonuclease [Deinococcus psychrotolerans]AZI41661.1 HNH endonuclease [Deinococcus psychrotolerans]
MNGEEKTSTRRPWTRLETLVAFEFYLVTPFGKFHRSNPEVIKLAEKLERTPSALAMKLCNLASLDTSLAATGLVNVSQLDKSLWQEMESDWESFFEEIKSASMSLLPDSLPLESADSNMSCEGLERAVMSQARVGQMVFRRAVLTAYDQKCCISGLDIPLLLRASHILPWAKDKANRLNPMNRLCLSSIHDQAFDKGIITISEDWRLRVSPLYKDVKQGFFRSTFLEFEGIRITLPKRFIPNQEFLTFHRDNIFQR